MDYGNGEPCSNRKQNLFGNIYAALIMSKMKKFLFLGLILISIECFASHSRHNNTGRKQELKDVRCPRHPASLFQIFGRKKTVK